MTALESLQKKNDELIARVDELHLKGEMMEATAADLLNQIENLKCPVCGHKMEGR